MKIYKSHLVLGNTVIQIEKQKYLPNLIIVKSFFQRNAMTKTFFKVKSIL